VEELGNGMDGGWLTRLLCWTDSGTRGLMRRESSWIVGGILICYGLAFAKVN
jgi:hypothetical protein